MARKARGRARRSKRDAKRRGGKKKVCRFCVDTVDYIDYKDVALLRQYMSDRGKIRNRQVTGNCQRHQNRVARAIKNAREMALLPYVATAQSGAENRVRRRRPRD